MLKKNNWNIKLLATIFFLGNALICTRYIFIASSVILFSRFELASGDRFAWPFRVIVVNVAIFIAALLALFLSVKLKADQSSRYASLIVLLIAVFTALEFIESISMIFKYEPVDSIQIFYSLIFPVIMLAWTIFALFFYWLTNRKQVQSL